MLSGIFHLFIIFLTIFRGENLKNLDGVGIFFSKTPDIFLKPWENFIKIPKIQKKIKKKNPRYILIKLKIPERFPKKSKKKSRKHIQKIQEKYYIPENLN